MKLGKKHFSAQWTEERWVNDVRVGLVPETVTRQSSSHKQKYKALSWAFQRELKCWWIIWIFLLEEDRSNKKIEMRSLKKARKPISTFDRSKDNSEATKTWPQESAKKLHAEEKYVTQLAVQIGRHSVRDKSCALFWWEGKNSQGYFCGWGRVCFWNKTQLDWGSPPFPVKIGGT